jgi:streptogramin lyase
MRAYRGSLARLILCLGAASVIALGSPTTAQTQSFAKFNVRSVGCPQNPTQGFPLTTIVPQLIQYTRQSVYYQFLTSNQVCFYGLFTSLYITPIAPDLAFFGSKALPQESEPIFSAPGLPEATPPAANSPVQTIWITDAGLNVIDFVKYDPDDQSNATLTAFPIPTTNASPAGIALGPDGSMWFVENLGDKIGRITSTGVITEFALPSGAVDARSIAAGSDGNMWFTNRAISGNSAIGQIGRITMSGAITEFPLPATSTPFEIAAGSDGNLWVAGLSEVDQITPAGVVTAFPQNAGSMVTTIAAGADGTLYFTDQGTNSIGRITTAGVSAEYAVPTANSGPLDIALGQNSILSFIEANTGNIGLFAQQNSFAVYLVSSVLPASRSISLIGATTATAFATIINTDTVTATSCGLVPTTIVPASFVYQTTNPVTNALTGSPNTPVDIPAGQSQSFVFAFTATAPMMSQDVMIGYACANENAVSNIVGLNTLHLSISATPVADVVALAASGDPGYVDIPGAMGTGDFAVATVNLGVDATITAAADTGMANLPVVLLVCETNPATGACLSAPAASVTTDIPPNATPTFGIFVTGNGSVADIAGVNRVFVTFTDAGGVLRGETSVAVRTQ